MVRIKYFNIFFTLPNLICCEFSVFYSMNEIIVFSHGKLIRSHPTTLLAAGAGGLLIFCQPIPPALFSRRWATTMLFGRF